MNDHLTTAAAGIFFNWLLGHLKFSKELPPVLPEIGLCVRVGPLSSPDRVIVIMGTLNQYSRGQSFNFYFAWN